MTSTPSRTDWGRLYRDHVAAVSALAGGLTEDQLLLSVPGTPAWRVRDVYAHLAGGPADQVTGRTDGAPGPEWTARHVGERAQLPIEELLAELASHQDAVAASVADDPQPGVVWDIAVHHADLHEALGRGVLPERLWAPVLAMLAPMRLGEDRAALEARVAPYELFRGVFSRRSRAQMAAWGVDLPLERLDGICVFGPREDAQPVPA